jgi:NAD(P)-dependent dehydrogenase (short-subunit alcohol dehydrogenase family)
MWNGEPRAMESENSELFSVKDRIVVVTGGLGQLGRQFSHTLVKRGAKVAIFDVLTDESHLVEIFGREHAKHNIISLSVDVTSKASIEAGLEQVSGRWGVPYGLINNAALDSPPNASIEENGPFEDYPEASWDKVMEVNVKGVILCCQVVGRAMAEAARGSIINIASIYGVVSPDQRLYEYRRRGGSTFFKPIAYSASKASLLNVTRYLATYWADRNVRVNTVTFGGVFNNQDEKFLEGYCARVPLGRMARADEYNGAIVFLLSDSSSYMTGSNMIIDGGWTAW